MSFYKKHAPNRRGHDREVPSIENFEGMRALEAETQIPSAQWEAECQRGHEYGLPPADSIEDKTEISTFQRGELPHWSGINTFLKTPYLEDVRKVGEYDVAFVGAPFRYRHDVSLGDAVWAAGNPPDFVALHDVQLRGGGRFTGKFEDV